MSIEPSDRATRRWRLAHHSACSPGPRPLARAGVRPRRPTGIMQGTFPSRMRPAGKGAGQHLLTDGVGAVARYPVVPSGAESGEMRPGGGGRSFPVVGEPRSVRCRMRRGGRRLLRQGLLDMVAPVVAIRALDVTHGRPGVLPAHVLHQILDIPVMTVGPGGEAASQGMATVAVGRGDPRRQDAPT